MVARIPHPDETPGTAARAPRPGMTGARRALRPRPYAVRKLLETRALRRERAGR
jgi:hypothetical protein